MPVSRTSPDTGFPICRFSIGSREEREVVAVLDERVAAIHAVNDPAEHSFDPLAASHLDEVRSKAVVT
jgi:hypothetical protein